MRSHAKADNFLLSSPGDWLSGFLAIIMLAEAGFALHQYQGLSAELAGTKADFSSVVASDQARITGLSAALASEQGQNAILGSQLLSEQQQKGQLQTQIQGLGSQVGVLQKLNSTDKQLLQKYSKVFFLNENYIPSSLTDIPPQYLSSAKAEIQFHAQALPFLLKMLDAAAVANAQLKVVSGYRSFGTQSTLKAAYKVHYGAGTANQFSAEQGYSEHQLGTAVDLATPASAGSLTDAFDTTAQSKWLVSNAYRYGFIISYPKNNKYYEYEPWHWRFVGVTLATMLHLQGKQFYDLDQRDIDPYLISIFDQ